MQAHAPASVLPGAGTWQVPAPVYTLHRPSVYAGAPLGGGTPCVSSARRARRRRAPDAPAGRGAALATAAAAATAIRAAVSGDRAHSSKELKDHLLSGTPTPSTPPPRRRMRDSIAEVVQAAMQALTATVMGDGKEDSKLWEAGELTDKDHTDAARVLHSESPLDFMRHLKTVRNKFEALIDASHIEVLKPTYGILAHDSCARRGASGGWSVPVEGWMFRRNENRHKTRLALCQKILIEMAVGVNKEAFSEDAKKRYEERGRLIFRNICFRGGEFERQLEVRFGGPDGGDDWRPLPEATDLYGRVSCELHLTDDEVQRFSGGQGHLLLEMRCRSRRSSPPECSAVISLVEEDGVSIISDIDDTVKVTEVFLGVDQVVRKTFYDEFEAITGMPELFQAWSRVSPDMGFHFVSNSPQELYEPLHDLLEDSGFPRAALHLRTLGSRGKERKEFKKRMILQLLGQFPRRRFVLVGDSGEGDAMMYADVYRQCPGQVARILIREVSADVQLDLSVFDGIDGNVWTVFRDPTEVLHQVQEVASLRRDLSTERAE